MADTRREESGMGLKLGFNLGAPLALLVLLALAACRGDETVSGYADPEATYRLEELAGVPFPARATIAFPEPGTVRGMAPCNIWSASQSAPYPWLELGPVIATRRACPDLALEARFFDVLSTMSLAEIQGEIVILSGDGDETMVFRKETQP